MHVKKLSTSEELVRYVDFAKEVYRDNHYWVPANKHHLIKLLSGNGGFGPQSEIQAFTVERDGRIVATVAALSDEAYHRHWNERLGHLHFFEALPDQTEAVDVLMSDACEWLRERGCTAGRLSMLAGVELPLTIDAYDAVPTCFNRYNPPYYHSYIKNSGFVTEHGLVEYEVEFTSELEHRYREMVRRVRLEPGSSTDAKQSA